MGEIIEAIVRFILEALFHLIVEVFFIWTGEIVLFIITFGKHRPRWDLYENDSASRYVIFSELSFWVGVGFWLLVIVLIFSSVELM